MDRDSREELLGMTFVEEIVVSEESVVADQEASEESVVADQGDFAFAVPEVECQEEESREEENTEAETGASVGGWALVEQLADSMNALDTTAKTECPANASEARSMHPKGKNKKLHLLIIIN